MATYNGGPSPSGGGLSIGSSGDPFIDAIQALLGMSVDQARAGALLDQAMVYVRLLAPCKATVWDAYAKLPVDVQHVVQAAVARSFTSPVGVRQETIGEYSVTYSGGSASSSTGPFTSDEGRVIGLTAGCGSAKLKTIHVGGNAPLHIDPVELIGVSDVDLKSNAGWQWEEPSHANGFNGRWVKV
jgi:hypothetical protein